MGATVTMTSGSQFLGCHLHVLQFMLDQCAPSVLLHDILHVTRMQWLQVLYMHSLSLAHQCTALC